MCVVHAEDVTVTLHNDSGYAVAANRQIFHGLILRSDTEIRAGIQEFAAI